MVDDDKRGKIEAHILALKNIPLFCIRGKTKCIN